MKTNNLSISSVSFQKKLVANATILNNGQQEQVKIYDLDKAKDIEDLKKAENSNLWKRSKFIHCVNIIFNPTNTSKYYVIENKNGEIISFAHIEKQKDYILHAIETAPALSVNNEGRTTRYIGETMLAFLAIQAKKTIWFYLSRELLTTKILLVFTKTVILN